MKTVDLEVRPIFHYAEKRVRAHVFLCMLAYYVQWHMQQALKPMLFHDEFADEVNRRKSPVTPAVRSEMAKWKDWTKRTLDGKCAHSFRTLLQDLATIARNRVASPLSSKAEFEVITEPSPEQRQALRLLRVSLTERM